MIPIRTALAGIGGCASSLVQFVNMARAAGTRVDGISHPRIGPYEVGDIDFVLAFDADSAKVGRDLTAAMTHESVAARHHFSVPPSGVMVHAGPLRDGLDGPLSEVVRPDEKCKTATEAEVTAILREAHVDVLACLLPTGAREDVHSYARAAANAGVAFINATPEPVALNADLAGLFADRGIPLLGDDLRSHVGATTLHMALIELLESRGLTVLDTYQLNVGGNADFYNLADPTRSTSKQRSKRRALQAAGLEARDVSAGPNGYVRFLGDTKTCFIRLDCRSVLGSELQLELRMNVEDSPNAAGVLVNAIRCAAHALQLGKSGVVEQVCPYLFKSSSWAAGESAALRAFASFAESAVA